MVNETSAQPDFLQRIIAASARNPFLTIFTVVALALWGYYCMRHIPLDAVPDLSDTQVILFTEWPGSLTSAMFGSKPTCTRLTCRWRRLDNL